MTCLSATSLAAALTLLAAGTAAAEPPSNRPEEGSFASQVIFACERGVEVPVTYVNTMDAHGFAVVQIDGRQVAMVQTRSGSGIRYRSISAAEPYVLHAKGEDATLFYGEGDDPAPILSGCKARID